MKLEKLPFLLTVAKYPALPEGVKGFFSLSRTGNEISLVCETQNLPQGYLIREGGWRAFRIVGTLDFSLVGILAALSGALAEAKIPIFALSTYDTDYLLVKEADFASAEAALKQKGYIII